MIKLFDKAKRVLFFPVGWANSITLWIQNICSPDDSIKIRNTCSPRSGHSLRLSLNFQKIYDGIKTYFSDYFVTWQELDKRLDDICDHNTIALTDGRMHVSNDFAKKETPVVIFNDDEKTNNVYDFKRCSTGNTSDFMTYVPSASLDMTSWTRGETVKVKGGDRFSPCGVRFQAVMRQERAGVYDLLYWRWVTFDASGLLYSISDEKGCFVVVNVNGYSGV